MISIHSRSASVLPAGLLGVIALTCPGCRDSRDPNTCWVSGSVSFDGEPIAHGDLIFETKKFGAAACRIKNGAFKMRVPKGEQEVRVFAFREVPMPPEKRPRQLPGEPPAPTTDIFQYLPERYNRDSALKVEVKKSGDTFTFELSSKPGPKK